VKALRELLDDGLETHPRIVVRSTRGWLKD